MHAHARVTSAPYQNQLKDKGFLRLCCVWEGDVTLAMVKDDE